MKKIDGFWLVALINKEYDYLERLQEANVSLEHKEIWVWCTTLLQYKIIEVNNIYQQ